MLPLTKFQEPPRNQRMLVSTVPYLQTFRGIDRKYSVQAMLVGATETARLHYLVKAFGTLTHIHTSHCESSPMEGNTL